MEIDTSITEYEPNIYENTDVKVPITASVTQQHNIPDKYDLDIYVTPMLPNTNREHAYESDEDDDIPKSTIEPENCTDIVEQERLLLLAREQPTDMFVNHLLLDYEQCEQKLENTRLMLFRYVRKLENFPFDSNTEMKQRMNTRTGDSAAVKLAYDIHALLSVIEGADYSSIKELISNSKRNTARKSLAVQIPNNCQCKCEINNLKDVVVSLQADLLLIKQRQAASENIRGKDSAEIKSSVNDIKLNLSTKHEEIQSEVKDMIKRMDNFSETIKSDVNICKSMVLKNGHNFKLLQDNLIELNRTIENMKRIMSSYHKTSPTVHSPRDVVNSQPQTLEQEPLIPTHAETVADDNLTSRDQDYETFFNSARDPAAPYSAELLQISEHTVNKNVESTTSFGNIPIPTRVSVRENRDKNKKKQKRVNFAIIDKNLGPRYYRNRHMNNTEDQPSDDYGDFSQYVKRKTRRFYVGGLKPTITEQKIASFVRNQGPKVTKVSVFRNRKFNTTTIRVNVEDDENANLLVDDPAFWPSGVVCRPWMPRNKYKQQYDYDDSRKEWDRRRSRYNPMVSENRDVTPTYNRYSLLEDDVDY